MTTPRQKTTSNETNNQQEDDLIRVAESALSAPLVTIRWLIIGVGVPLHILIASVIFRTRQLHNPRNAFWLGNIACHLSTLLMGAFELMVLTQKQVFFCRIYSLLVGSPYTNLLVGLLLATTDRWIAINHPLYHRKHVTVKSVAVCLVTSWVVVLFALTSPYWSGKIQLPSCFVEPEVMMGITLSHFVLVVFIIFGQVMVCIKTRKYLRLNAYPPSSIERGTSGGQQQPVAAVPSSSRSSSNTTLKTDKYFVHLPNKTISRLELEASVTLWCGMVSLCIFTLPLACIFPVIVVCRVKGLPWCEKAVNLVPYAREFLLLHAVVSPLIYVFRSREFTRAFRRMLPSCFRVHQRRTEDIPLRQF